MINIKCSVLKENKVKKNPLNGTTHRGEREREYI